MGVTASMAPVTDMSSSVSALLDEVAHDDEHHEVEGRELGQLPLAEGAQDEPQEERRSPPSGRRCPSGGHPGRVLER